ncbi:MAG: Sua5/YciO/YrdC/YwlC family protein [Corallincola sp.]|nr:Sua5/YciO/YrdC/YwlC family protein [Corallincola sp.]
MVPVDEALNAAVTAVRAGGVIVYATEGVLGLGCDPHCLAAVERILTIKQRDPAKGLILIAADYSQLLPWVDDDAIAIEQRAAVFGRWPGAVTWLLPVRTEVSRLLRGDFATIAVRVTNHPQVVALCRQLGHPLVSTSANIGGEPAPASFAELDPRVAAAADYCLIGETLGRRGPSTILRLDGVAIREGGP